MSEFTRMGRGVVIGLMLATGGACRAEIGERVEPGMKPAGVGATATVEARLRAASVASGVEKTSAEILKSLPAGWTIVVDAEGGHAVVEDACFEPIRIVISTGPDRIPRITWNFALEPDTYVIESARRMTSNRVRLALRSPRAGAPPGIVDVALVNPSEGLWRMTSTSPGFKLPKTLWVSDDMRGRLPVKKVPCFPLG